MIDFILEGNEMKGVVTDAVVGVLHHCNLYRFYVIKRSVIAAQANTLIKKSLLHYLITKLLHSYVNSTILLFQRRT